jgi:hypothetical protein
VRCSQLNPGEQFRGTNWQTAEKLSIVPRFGFICTPQTPMLTDKQCKSAVCPTDKKRARFTDSGGLYLEVSPAGSKRWFWKMYADGKEGRLALGSYPTVGLADARRARDFRAIALEWYDKQSNQWSPGHATRALRQFERDLFPLAGCPKAERRGTP